MIMPTAAPDPQVTGPDPTIVTGGRMFPEEIHKQIQAAMDAKGQTAVDAATAAATEAEAAKAAEAARKAAGPKPKVPGQPTPPAKPAAAAPAGDELKYPRSAIQWEEWKKTERERMQKEFEDKSKTLTPTHNGDYDKIKSERDQLAKHLQLVAIERDPTFNKEFENASAAVLASAKAASGKHADAFEKVLKMPPSEARDEAIEKLMEDVPAYKQTQIGYALAEMDKLRNLKEARIRESVANWEQMQTQSFEQRKQSQAAERAQMVKVLDKTISDWTDKEKGLPVFQKRDGDDAWNAMVDDQIEVARNVFGGELDVDSIAKAAMWAASAPLLLKDNATLLEQIKAKDAEIAQLKGLSPGADGLGGGLPAGGGEDDVPANMEYGAAVAAAVRRAGIQMGG